MPVSYSPWEHWLHELAAVAVPYWPAAQNWQTERPVVGVYMPAAQDKHAADVGAPVPVPYVPTGHTVQASALGALREVE